MKDTGKRCDLEAGMAKAFCAEMAEHVTSEAMQIFGGYGYSREFPAQRFWRDARVFRIFEGTSEIQYEVIADREVLEGSSRATGSPDRHPPRAPVAITSYWISLVPSKMRKTRASRQKRCAGNSRE